MNAFPTEVLFLSKADIDAIITYEDVVAAVESAFRADGNGDMYIPPKEIMEVQPGTANALFAMPGLLKDIGVAGVKWTGFYPQNPDGLPTLWGLLLLLSHMRNGQPFAILDATTITAMRTAGGHAVVAARHLARSGAKTLGVLGCGAQGRSGIQSFDRHFALDRIVVHDARPEFFDRLRPELAGTLRAKLEWAETPEALARQSDILLTATTCETPLIKAEWIPKGCFVAAMYAFHDLDPAFGAAADKWVLGHAGSDRIEILDEPAFRGKIDAANVYGTLGEIVAGKKHGRQNDEERIVFTHMGMGSLDIAVGTRLVEKARKQGLGKTLRLT